MNLTLSVINFIIHDKNGELMTDFSLDAVNFDMNVTSQPLIAEVDNNLNNLKFKYQKVNKQGNVYLDVREIMRDNSNAFDDAGDEIN